MKNSILLLALALPLVGCNTLKKLTMSPDKETPASHGLPDDYTVTGTTTIDFQIIQPVRCLDSSISVRVKVPGALEFRTLNIYEFKADTNGVGGGGVYFKRVCYPTFNREGTLTNLIVTSTPVAPVGTQYEIRSVLNVTNHSLY